MAFFPMHFWMVRAYMSVSPIMLTYIASISTILGTYIILRFLHFTVDISFIWNKLAVGLKISSLITITICTFIASRADNLKKIIVYSTCSQIGYVFLLITFWENRDLLLQLILIDGVNKIALFSFIAHIELKLPNLDSANIVTIKDSSLFKMIVAFILLNSASLPITSMFFVKLRIIDLLLSNNLVIEFLIVILGSVFAILYHLNFVKLLYFTHNDHKKVKINTKITGLIFISTIQVLTLIYLNYIILETSNINMFIT